MPLVESYVISVYTQDKNGVVTLIRNTPFADGADAQKQVEVALAANAQSDQSTGSLSFARIETHLILDKTVPPDLTPVSIDPAITPTPKG